MGKRDAEWMKGNRGAHEEGILKAGRQGRAHGSREWYAPAIRVTAVDHGREHLLWRHVALREGFACIYNAFGLVRGGVSTRSAGIFGKFGFACGAHERQVMRNVRFEFGLVSEHACTGKGGRTARQRPATKDRCDVRA